MRGKHTATGTGKMHTRVGTLHPVIRLLRNGDFSTEMFRLFQHSEQALVPTLMERLIIGVSIRKVAAITEELRGSSFSQSIVSAQCMA